MSPATLTRSLTARSFLFDDTSGADTAEALNRSLGEHGVARTAIHGVGRLSGSALQAVDREIGTVTDGLLDLDIGDMLVSGWRKYAALTKAAHSTLAAPGSEEVVVLATHRITFTHRPQIDLFVDDVKVNTLGFQLTMVFDVNGLVAVVRSGELVALRGGECVLTATLSLEGGQLAQQQRRIDLPVVVRLRPAIALVGGDATPPTMP
jgi:hypothetical protein